MTKTMIAVLSACALFVGCDKGGGGGDGKAAGDSVGVAECDDYIKKMEACFAKDPTTKAAAEAGFNATRDAWKKAAAAGGAQKDALKQGCAAALQSIPPTCK